MSVFRNIKMYMSVLNIHYLYALNPMYFSSHPCACSAGSGCVTGLLACRRAEKKEVGSLFNIQYSAQMSTQSAQMSIL